MSVECTIALLSTYSPTEIQERGEDRANARCIPQQVPVGFVQGHGLCADNPQLPESPYVSESPCRPP